MEICDAAIEAGKTARPNTALLVFTGVNWLLADRLLLDHNKFFDLLLAGTGCNNGDETECGQ